MKCLHLPILTCALALLCHPASWADPQSDDVLGSFILFQKDAPSGALLGARHKASMQALLEDEKPRLSLFGANQELPENEAIPQEIVSYNKPSMRIDSRTLMMSDVVVTAMGYLGKPYVYGQSSLNGGFDCSGFVLSLYQRSMGHTLPRTAAQQASATNTIARSDLEPGDLVFFNTLRRQFSHVGIYIGEGRFIHSPRAGASIRIESMSSTYWQKRFNGARRVITEESMHVASNSQ